LWNFLDEENIPALLRHRGSGLNPEADDTRGVWLYANGERRDARVGPAGSARRAGREKAVVTVLGAVPIRARDRRLHDLVRSVGDREAGWYAVRSGGDDRDLERIYEQLRGRRLRDHHSYDSAKGEYGSPDS